jgi:hypothetical protein
LKVGLVRNELRKTGQGLFPVSPEKLAERLLSRGLGSGDAGTEADLVVVLVEEAEEDDMTLWKVVGVEEEEEVCTARFFSIRC